MKKITMEPGKRYKGYAYLNEYGQIHFDPEQTGSRAEAKKLVVNEEDYTCYETKNYVVLHLRIPKSCDRRAKLKTFLEIVNQIITVIQEYDF